jgi:beta-glucosidase
MKDLVTSSTLTWRESVYNSLQESLLPIQSFLVKRISVYSFQVFQFILLAPVTGFFCLLEGVENWIYPKQDSPLVAFAKHPLAWQENVPRPNLPIGASTAAFHDNGPLVHKNTQFGRLYLKDHPELFHASFQFPNMWEKPECFLDKLNEMGAETFRFSIPRDLIEPEEGKFDEVAIEKIIDFCKQLEKKNISSVVTLEHFARPLYQTFETEEGIESFVKYVEKVTPLLYEAGVRKIVSFNEIGVEPFQAYIMGAFPPYHRADFEGAARFFTQMMKAHTRVYEAIKSRHPDLEVGLSHDPIRFRYFHKYHPLWSPIERLVCKVLTAVNHTMVMEALKTGTVTLKIPLRCNYLVELEKAIPFDFVGLQYYTDPLVKLSFFGGESATRVPEEKTTAYQFRQYPQGLASAIDEISALGKPIDLTEIGIDTGINKGDDDHERISYFNKIFQVVQKALDEGKEVRSLHLWTLIDNFDWHQGWTLPKACPIRFGLYRFDYRTGEIVPRGIVSWLKNKIQKY